MFGRQILNNRLFREIIHGRRAPDRPRSSLGRDIHDKRDRKAKLQCRLSLQHHKFESFLSRGNDSK